MAEPQPIVTGDEFIRALLESGMVRPGERVRRVVIDAQVGEATVVHIERYGDTRLLRVARLLEGVEITRADPTS